MDFTYNLWFAFQLSQTIMLSILVQSSKKGEKKYECQFLPLRALPPTLFQGKNSKYNGKFEWKNYFQLELSRNAWL